MRFQNLVNEGLPEVGLASSLRSAMALFYFSQLVFFSLRYISSPDPVSMSLLLLP